MEEKYMQETLIGLAGGNLLNLLGRTLKIMYSNEMEAAFEFKIKINWNFWDNFPNWINFIIIKPKIIDSNDDINWYWFAIW